MRTRSTNTAVALLSGAAFLFATSLQAQIVPSSTATAQNDKDPWWKHAVVYEVYPRSFADSNGDGVGDLNGVTKHLDYIQRLGADAIWLTPIYPSPQVDFGYDISDYKSVEPQYGSLADFDKLVAGANKRGLRVVLDMVLNHTSDKSAWFLESASSRTNPKANWYVWNDGIPASSPNLSPSQKDVHDGLNGKVVAPNNWLSLFGGSAWTWVPARKQFYYHKFYAEQPDLNWREPQVENTMFDAMRFWLDRGVAGFRLDAVQFLFEDPQLPNTPENNPWGAGVTSDLPDVHAVLKRLRAMVNSYPGDRVLIGEIVAPTMGQLDSWYGGAAKDELQLPMDYYFGFPHMASGDYMAAHDKLNAEFYRKQLVAMTTQLHGSRPFIFFDNHDNIRSRTRFGDGAHDGEIARVNAALLFTAPATAQTYNGAEIGMVNTDPARREDVKDMIGRLQWPQNKGRDGERTPMQWTPGPQAGFSTNPNTWLPIPPSYKSTNVETEKREPDSLLNWYEALIALRRSSPALRDGGLQVVDEKNTSVLSFVRNPVKGGRPVLVMLNMAAEAQTASVDLSSVSTGTGSLRKLLASPGQSAPASARNVRLAPYGVLIAEVE